MLSLPGWSAQNRLSTYHEIIFVDILCGYAAQNINEKLFLDRYGLFFIAGMENGR